MFDSFLVFLIILSILAVIVQDDFIFTIVYLFIGAYIIGRWWSGRSLKHLAFSRTYNQRAYWGEDVSVQLNIQNLSLLPVVWLRLHESLPVELATASTVREVITLGPHGKANFTYALRARKRGYYPIGPMFISSGDLLGFSRDNRKQFTTNHLIVYPKIINFTAIRLPSSSPMGTLRAYQPLFEDPSRVRGKRDYVVGDSLRRVDWKTTAITGRLQIKLYEPSMALETAIFLNLNEEEFELHSRIDALELAITVAASIANWVSSKKQAVGFYSNGLDPLSTDGNAIMIPPRKSRSHLTRVLDVLARIQSAPVNPVADLVHQQSPHLTWGTTLILITGRADEPLFDELFKARQMGLNAVLILSGQAPEYRLVKQRADQFGIPLYHFIHESDLDLWRK